MIQRGTDKSKGGGGGGLQCLDGHLSVLSALLKDADHALFRSLLPFLFSSRLAPAEWDRAGRKFEPLELWMRSRRYSAETLW